MMTYPLDIDLYTLEGCEKAVKQLCGMVSYYHGTAVARHLFLKAAPSRRNVRAEKNIRLMVAYILSKLNVRQCAVELAGKNKSLPQNLRFGPSGTTDAKTLEKQMRRLKKRMNKDQSYREEIEWEVECANDLKAGTTDV